MADYEFEAAVRKHNGKVIIDLQGEINAFAEPDLAEAYSEVDEHNPTSVLLNFENVDYINSTGIALIVSLLAQARKSQRQVVVFGLSDHYMEIFEITRLSDFMNIYDDEAAALAA
jgi:anti-anti-sigma factor